ncbi:MAG: anaerobic glycerol-3-phosphate dehydrogenase subunit C [Acidobacteriota bacterium]
MFKKMIEGEKIEQDLKKMIRGEVYCDNHHRILYSTAACIYQIMPLGVVLPRDEEDLARVVAYARENRIPVTARGAGSGVAGQTVNNGLIIDFSKYMNRVLAIDPEKNTVRVQPGLVYDQLNKILKSHGRFFPPDPSSGSFCTIGGMIGNNAGGSHSIAYGPVKDNIVSIRGIVGTGDFIGTEKLSWKAIDEQSFSGNAHLGLARRFAGILKGKERIIEAWKPQANRNSSGYNIFDSVDDGGIDLAKLFVGSEGTLCLVTEAILKIMPIPVKRGTALALFDNLEKAGEAVVEILNFSPSCLEIMDQTFVRLIREEVPEMRETLPGDCKAIIILDVDGNDAREVESRIDAIGASLLKKRLAIEYRKALENKEQERLWSYRKSASPILSSKEGVKRNTRFVEDSSLLPERLPVFINGMRRIISAHGFEVAIFGHAGDSNIHVNPLLNQKDPGDIDKLERIADEASELVLSLRGSLTGEHGDGRLRTPYLPKMFGPLYGTFEEIKKLFDPEGLFNPGIKVGNPGYRITDNLRYGKSYSRIKAGSIFDEDEWAIEVEKCHGCGTCRQYCPVFAATGDERATARAKANLIRACISNRVDSISLLDSELKEMIDLCFNCRICHSECPTKIRIPEIAFLAKEFYSQRKGYKRSTFLLNRSCLLSRLGSTFPEISNRVIESRLLMKMSEALTGISASLELPRFSRRTIEREKGVFCPSGGSRKAAYYYGCYANFNDPDGEGWGTIEVLIRNGFDVLLPPQACCGIAKISNGEIESVIPDAQYNIEVLSELIDAGYIIVYSAPSCGMVIVEDYPRMLRTEKAINVAENCFEIHELLIMLESRGKLNKNFGKVSGRIVYHNPCHLKSRGMGGETIRMLKMIPALEIEEIEDSCCGMAGTFGMKSEYRKLSVEIGKPLFESINGSHAGTVATGCGTCNIQIKNCTSKQVIHPVSILAQSYKSFDAD